MKAESPGMSASVGHKSTAKWIIAIFGAAIVLGALQHAVLPGGLWTDPARRGATVDLASLPTISVADARAMRMAGTAAIVDARPRDPAEALPGGVISIPVGLSDNPDLIWRRLRDEPPARTILVHCGDASCGQSRVVAAAIRRLGWTDVRVVRGAW